MYPTASAITRKTISDVVAYEANNHFNRESGDLTAGAGGLDLQIGTLLTGGDVPAAYDDAAPAAVTGVLLTDVRADDGEFVPIAWAARGPATLIETGLELPADEARADTIRDALRALNFKLVPGTPV